MMRSYSLSARSRGDRVEMSGARTPEALASGAGAPASASPCGAPCACACACAASTGGVERKRWPASSATSETIAIPATAQGSVVELASARPPPDAPAATPQRWQNFAPGVRIVAQAEQREPANGEPQLAQKCPLAGSPQVGQMAGVPVGCTPTGGRVMWRNLSGVEAHRLRAIFQLPTYPHRLPADASRIARAR